jgi:dienelactone hydrolase
MGVAMRRVFLLVLLIGVACLEGCRSRLEFASVIDDLSIPAEVHRPDGAGPFPAVLLLAPCSGVAPFMRDWALWLRSQGYAALVIDSHSPRRTASVCLGGSPAVEEVALDAVAALRHLAGLPWIDSGRLAVMGWSHGASAALEMEVLAGFYRAPELRAVVAVYPGCDMLDPGTGVPTLLILAGMDDWTPPDACLRTGNIMQRRGRPVYWTLYPQATHSFDQPGAERHYLGHRVAHDAGATFDARERVSRFLAEHFYAKR